MTALNPPTYLAAGTYSARYDRLMLASLLTPQHGTGALAIRPGVRPSPGGAALAVSQRATPAMFVTVAAGTCYIQSPSATGGSYICHNDAPVDVAISASHATLGRRDLVVARVYDAEISGTTNAWALEVVTGTAAGSPVTPATPSGAIPLAVVQVNAGTSTITNSNITDSRSFTAAVGGTIPAPATAMPANPHTGMAVYDTTNAVPKWWNGAAWRSWADEGYTTTAGVNAILSSGGYVTQSTLDSNGYKPIFWVVKSSNQSKTNTTMGTDNHLQMSVAANATYYVEMLIFYQAHEDADIIISFTGPSGATFDWLSDMLTTLTPSGAGSDEVSRSQQGISNTPAGGGRGNSNGAVAPIRGVLKTTNSGTFALRWAQFAASASATIVLAGSFMKLTKLG